LTDQDRALFDSVPTQNFELVLGELSSAIRVLDALGKDTGGLLARYRSIQAALGAAVRAVHVPWTSPNCVRPCSSIRPRSSSVETGESEFTPRIRAISGRATG
jgi:hypothetical protein